MENEIESLFGLLKGKDVIARTYKGKVYKLENVNETLRILIMGNDNKLHQLNFVDAYVQGLFKFKNEAINTQLEELKIIKRARAKK